ncbi:MAG TPA: hypothetical protein PKE47_01300, partial [Verrucomicrobiota bacterium]|nr:hypothetical protein [Verrucomicrobiota bacterium]
VGIGRRPLRITNLGILPRHEKLWVWYGVNDLGTLEVKRARGRLEVEVPEGARRSLLKGEHFAVDQAGRASFSGDVPEDVYTLAALYPGFLIASNLAVKLEGAGERWGRMRPI